VLGEKLAHTKHQLVADRRPARRNLKVADVVGHEARARRKQRQVAAALAHQLELIGLDRLAQLVVADLEVRGWGLLGRILDAGDLLVAPVFQRLGRGGEVAVAVDDHVKVSNKKLKRTDPDRIAARARLPQALASTARCRD
jgi:hypothetical protein